MIGSHHTHIDYMVHPKLFKFGIGIVRIINTLITLPLRYQY